MPHARVPVVRVITRLNIGGPAIQAIDLSGRLTAHGFDTLLIHGQLGEGEGDMSGLLDEGEGSHVFLPSLGRTVSPLRDLRACWQIYRHLSRVRPHVVHTHTAKAGALGRVAAAVYNRTIGRGAPACVVHTYHGHVLEGYFAAPVSRLFIGAERLLAHWTDALVAISPRIAEELLARHGIGRKEQYRVIPLGFDLSAFASIDEHSRTCARRDLGIPEGRPVVGWVGRLTAIKDPGLFLEAARLVRERHPDTVFLVAGDGELRHDVETRAAGDARLDVRFLGWRRDLARIYAAIDVLLLTSRNEGTPVALIEAMASGRPCVSTDVGGVSDVITGSELGALAPYADAAALADAVAAFLAGPALRQQTGALARQAVLARYSADRLAEDVVNLYENLISKTTKAQAFA